MWSAELAHQIRLAYPGGGRVKQPSPRPLPLAGFQLTTEAVVGSSSSSSSSCFSQQKHSKPARRYTALWPRNARNGSITLHHDQYPATVSFKTASTTERKPNIQNPMA